MSVLIGNGLTRIAASAFSQCSSLATVTIGNGITSIASGAFAYCYSLSGVYFEGNAPGIGGSYVFNGDYSATVYYLPGTTGWGQTFGGLPTSPWTLPNPLILANGPGFGIQTNGFGFIISWATNVPVVIEACTNLANPAWYPVGTSTLTRAMSYFTDPLWTNYPARFYRLRLPL